MFPDALFFYLIVFFHYFYFTRIKTMQLYNLLYPPSPSFLLEVTMVSGQ